MTPSVRKMPRGQKKPIIEIIDLEDEEKEIPVKVKKKVGKKRKSDIFEVDMGCVSSKKLKTNDNENKKSSTKLSESVNTCDFLEPVSPIDSKNDNDNKNSVKKSTKSATRKKSVKNDNEKTSLNELSKFENVKKLNPDSESLIHEWDNVDYIQEFNHVSRHVAETLVKLFDEDNTVPFIARYRRSQTGGLDADQLRLIKESYDRASLIKQKINTVIKSIDKVGKWSPEFHNMIKSVKTLSELEHIRALYKISSKISLAEKARELGLGPFAEAILQGKKVPYFNTLINHNKEGLQDEEKIKNGVICILADMINKNKLIFEKIKELREKFSMQINTSKVKVSSTASKDSKSNKKNNDEDKFQMYYDWSNSEKNIKPHHVLAINRAEAKKIITVNITIPNHFETMLKTSVLDIYHCAVIASPFHKMLIIDAFHQAYKKSISPAIIRRIRSELKEKAEEASMEVFAVNVKQLLLTRPVRGKTILGIDPGFTHGCKLAVVSAQGEVLETKIIYPHCKDRNAQSEAANVLVSLVNKYQCSTLALGNATACRETEVFISNLIKSKQFHPQEVDYTIVNETGTSIYSCSSEAKAEFPTLDYNVISAVSIARRFQDPLAELVKVEPKHLGVGMYQHDLPEKQLMSKLNEVVVEAVSFVGVDLNTASHCLLRRVAGISDTRATNIIDWRKTNGPFTNKNQLLKVKGIGVKTYEQCAGFIRILPETALGQSTEKIKASALKNFNYLDRTWIHPESYGVANAFIKAAGVELKDLGSRNFISAINVFAGQGYAVLAKKFKTNEETLEMIVEGLKMAEGEDIRRYSKAPLFRNSLRSMADLVVGSVLSGEVRNVVDFGAFVDVGVEKAGLIHTTSLDGEVLTLGQRVDVKVTNIDKVRGRLGLVLIKNF